MVARYLIAGAISAALAGGAVWMGAEAGALGIASHPHKDSAPAVTKDKAPEAATGSHSDMKSSSSKEAIADMTRPSEATSKPRSYGSGTGHTMDHDPSEAKRAEDSGAKDAKRPKKAWLDDYLKARDTDAAADAMDAKAMDGHESGGAHGGKHGSTKTMDKLLRDTSPMRTTIETLDKDKRLEPAPRDMHQGHVHGTAHGTAKGTANYSVERKEGMTIIRERDTKSDDNSFSDGSYDIDVKRTPKGLLSGNRGADGTYSLLLDEASKLEIEDMRDDAYLNIIDYALGHEDHNRAAELVDNLSTPELRDTARQRIGVSHAQAGDLDGAFALISDLEVKELTDAIRLEFIRAAAHPSPKSGPAKHR